MAEAEQVGRVIGLLQRRQPRVRCRLECGGDLLHRPVVVAEQVQHRLCRFPPGQVRRPRCRRSSSWPLRCLAAGRDHEHREGRLAISDRVGHGRGRPARRRAAAPRPASPGSRAGPATATSSSRARRTARRRARPRGTRVGSGGSRWMVGLAANDISATLSNTGAGPRIGATSRRPPRRCRSGDTQMHAEALAQGLRHVRQRREPQQRERGRQFSGTVRLQARQVERTSAARSPG